MCHTSPSTFLLWSILSTTLCVFLIAHLWSFDRFRCLKWKNPSSGAFKRIMTYSYLCSVPLMVGYSVGFSVIKYSEGYVSLPFFGVIPKPYQLWTPAHQSLIIPFYMMFSVAWGLEIVTHLEELCFWLFLLHSTNTEHMDWFRSPHFRSWCAGSVAAVIGIPLVTFFNRADPLKAEAFTFLIASSGSFLLTVLFLPVLICFPTFLQRLKAEGTQPRVVLRLWKFHELNVIRVAFRFIFVSSFLALGIDGVRPKHYLNVVPFWTDFLAMSGAIGCMVSSVITLMVFFPRNLEAEAGFAKSSRQHSEVHVYRAASEKRSTFVMQDAPSRLKITHPYSYADGAEEIQPKDALVELYKAAKLDELETPFQVGAIEDEERLLEDSKGILVTQVKYNSSQEDLFHSDSPTSPAGDSTTQPPGLSPSHIRPRAQLAVPARVQPRRSVAAPWPEPGVGHGNLQYPPQTRFETTTGGTRLDITSSRVHPLVRNYRSPIDLMDDYARVKRSMPRV